MRTLGVLIVSLALAGCAGLKVSAGPLDLETKTEVIGVSVNLSKDGKLLGGIAPYISLKEIGGLFGSVFSAAK